jgi:DNA-binding LacI/PurR family transcriptional regulator
MAWPWSGSMISPSALTWTRLSRSVEQPVHQLAREAAGLLLRILANDPLESTVRVLPTQLMERASVGPLTD